MKKTKKQTASNRKSSFLFLLRIYLKNSGPWFWVVAASTVVAPVLAYLNVVILRDAIDFLSMGKPLSSILWHFALILGIFLVFSTIDLLLEEFFGENQNILISNRINRKIYERVTHTDYRYFDNTQFYDDYTWTLNNFYRQTFSAAQTIWRLLGALFTIGTIGALVISMDVVVLGAVVLIVVLQMLLTNAIQTQNYRKDRASLPFGRLLGYIQRVLYMKDYAMSVKTTRVKDELLEKYDGATQQLSATVKRYRGKATLLTFLSNTLYYGVYVATLGYLVARVYYGKITIGELSALFVAFTTLKGQLEQFTELVSQLKNLNLYTESIQKFFSLPSNIENDENSAEKQTLNPGPLSVQFDSVSFRYHETEADVLKNISFRIEPGQKVALVGRNGAGKSTIAKLILRLYDIENGTISINGKKIQDLNTDALRNQVGVAFQDSTVYAFNVRENVDVYDGCVSDEQLKQVFEKLGVDQILQKKNAGLDTAITRELDEHGIELSGGEKQLLAVSRVMTKPFGLLIFDEPSSALDPEREHRLYEIMMKETGNATVLLISHRLSAVKNADQILMVEDGQIIEAGTHQELMKLCGKYSEFYHMQADGFSE